MYTPDFRAGLRESLLERAHADSRLTAAALTGSAAVHAEDAWSDVDLAFAVREAALLGAALEDWTAHLYAAHGAVAHTDVRAGAWLYRVFLLSNTLQVDLAFVPQSDFCPLGLAFQVVFGQAGSAMAFPEPDAAGLIGMAWLHALHVRSALQRGKLWQAAYMINGTREHVLLLACLRHGLSTHHARGYDQLPGELLDPLAASFPRELSAGELQRAFAIVVDALLRECRYVDAELAGKLQAPLQTIV